MISQLLWRDLINNNPVFHFYAVIEFYLIVKIYQTVLAKIIPSIYFNILFIGFISFAVINAVWFQKLTEFNSNVTMISSFLYLILTLIYFFTLLDAKTLNRLDRNPAFWVSIGILIYYATNSVLFFINQNVELMLQDRYTVWGLHALVNIVLITFYTIALWIRPEEN
jgi:hypothetical protein